MPDEYPCPGYAAAAAAWDNASDDPPAESAEEWVDYLGEEAGE